MRITDRHVEMASSGRRAKVALLKKRFRLRRSSKRVLEHEDDGGETEEAVVDHGEVEEGSTSSSEEEEEEEAHSHLLSAITDLDHRKKRQRSEATPTASQFHLRPGEEVSVGGLLQGVEAEGRGVRGLRRQLATPTSHHLSPPATKQQVEKGHRALAYSAACREVGKWLPVVTHNRKAAHLLFPLQEETVPAPSLTSRTENFQAVNELERAVQGVLVKSEAVTEATDTELTAAERAELVRVMVEEGRERVREGRRWRRLLSQYEARCQRESRIKSRRFHKVQRKRREKTSAMREEQEEEQEEKAERLRATERMTLRHSRQGRWAREVLARGKRDSAAKTALSEHTMRGRALTQHPRTLGSEEEEEEEEKVVGTEEKDSNAPSTVTLPDHHGNPWLDSVPVLLLNSELSQDRKMSGDQEVNFKPSDQGKEWCSGVNEKHKSLTSSNERQSSDITSSATPTINPTAFLTSQKVGGSLGVASQQLLHVHEAFAGDDVMNDFEEEKRETERKKNNTASQETLHLPGWGVWGGEGTRQVKRVKDKPREAVKHRSDRELGHVIISDHSNTKINKHLVKKVPWPFSSAQQFSRVQATPLGRQWNSEIVHRQMVKPRVETPVGVVIPPIRLTDDVKDFMKRQNTIKHK